MADQKAPVVHGIYLGHVLPRGFRYQYQCEVCKRKFIAHAPELSAPALCHQCYTGGKR